MGQRRQQESWVTWEPETQDNEDVLHLIHGWEDRAVERRMDDGDSKHLWNTRRQKRGNEFNGHTLRSTHPQVQSLEVRTHTALALSPGKHSYRCAEKLLVKQKERLSNRQSVTVNGLSSMSIVSISCVPVCLRLSVSLPTRCMNTYSPVPEHTPSKNQGNKLHQRCLH